MIERKTRTRRGRGAVFFLGLLVLAICGPFTVTFPVFIGSADPASFKLCEEALDGSGAPRLECQAGDLRFQVSNPTGSQFGFSLAAGHLNGDNLVDLVVGDPARNRAYIFYGRTSAQQAYGLLPNALNRGVNPDTQADVILWRDPAVPGQVKNFGYAIAISERQTVSSCTPSGLAAALAIGAPGQPETTTNAPGMVFHMPAGALCRTPSNPALTQTIDPGSLGELFHSPDPEQNDLFGYSAAFGRVLSNTGTQEDLIVGATGALGGAGRVTAFPVTGGIVSRADGTLVRIEGLPGDGAGEVIAGGDLDNDFNATTNPRGSRDDLAIGAVGQQAGKVIMAQGPLSPTGSVGMNGVYLEGADTPIRAIQGEIAGDFFGFSVAVSADGRLAVGGVLADNNPPATSGTGGGDRLTNAKTGSRVNAGKVYVWDPALLAPGPALEANTADLVVVARRSGDQLGFAVGFGDVDGSGEDDLLIAARREDGSGLKVNEIDQGTVYVILNTPSLTSPVDLNLCAANSDCTGVDGVDVLIFGSDRSLSLGDEIGFALAAGNFNGDTSDDIFVSSQTHQRVYAVTLEDTDGDRTTQGRNMRDEDDDADGDPDATDCAPQNAAIHAGATEIRCNTVDENCNGTADEAPDADGDGFTLCGSTGKPVDCDDNDATSFSGATEACDGNDNDCSGSVPANERDADGDFYVACSGWNDTQHDQSSILGGDDCSASNIDVFPGAAPRDNPAACMRDRDKDDFGDVSPGTGITAGTDCDDLGAQTFPGSAPGDNPTGCLKDADGDDFGDAGVSSPVVKGTDCNDVDIRSFPGAPELCDGNDNACAGAVPAGERDPDSDRYVECAGWSDTQNDNANILGGGDCDPADGRTFPGAAPQETQAAACMTDKDGDDFGDQTPAIAGITPGTDCDDDSTAAAATFPGAAAIDGPLNCMKDGDGDDYGDGSAALPVVAGTDCNDASATQNPGATEIPDDSIDQDCSGADQVTCFVDADLDGFGSTTPLVDADGICTDPGESPFDTDCDDTNPNFAPGRTEIPDDGIDQDCSGDDTVTCFVDADGDGAGTSLGTTVLAADGTCDAAQDEAAAATDCNDADPNTHPGAPELCDGDNNACTGPVPINETDVDGDGHVACSSWNDTQGDDPTVAGGADCAPADPYVFPGAAPGEAFSAACMKDTDGDDYGDLDPPAGVVRGTDCDDSPSGASTFPGAAPHDGPLNCMKDSDGDDYGDSSASLPVVRGTDCNDADLTSFPGAPQLCDGNDNACGGSVPLNETDTDGDGYVGCAGWSDTQGDNPGVAGGGDCGPSDPRTFPGVATREVFAAACMKDQDGDGYGDLRPPAGVVRGTDCDDDSSSAAATFPGAAAIDGPQNCMKDGDGDDYGDASASLPVVRGTDCDDGVPAVHPGALEGPPGNAVCSDTADNDCDGLVDASDPGCQVVAPCPDADADGFADCTTNALCDSTGMTCGDCDDNSGAVHPGVGEVCDNQDDDCDGTVDDGFDQDADGYTTCQLPAPDCDDTDAQVHPLALEACNDGLDNDCNPATADLFDSDGDGAACDVDCDDGDASLNLLDADTDGYTTCGGDCDDAAVAIHPGAAEVCADGLDNDCNPATPDSSDSDGDGAACGADCDDTDPALNLDDADGDGATSCGGDCDDADPAIKPTAAEICDGVDNNCDGTIDNGFDLDGDGFSTCQQPFPDCNDSAASINPGHREVCNDGIDNDCNPATADVADLDADGVTCTLDCNDYDPNTFPGAPERCDGNINDCGGPLPADETDTDGDRFVACAPWSDTQGDNLSILGGGDCDGTDADTFPGAAPNEAFATACMRDRDGDDYGDLTPPGSVTPGTDCDDDSATAADTFPGAAAVDGPFNCMKDSDDDDYGDGAVSLPVVPGTDCNDADPNRHPLAPEICEDGIDSDCDGQDPVCAPAGPLVFLSDPNTVTWSPVDPAITGVVNVYRGDLEALQRTGVYTQDPGTEPGADRFCRIDGSSLEDPFVPIAGVAVFYLTTSGQGSTETGLGIDSRGVERPNTRPCP